MFVGKIGMYNLIPPLILIFSLAGLIVLFAKKFPQTMDSLRKEETGIDQDKFDEKGLRVFGYQKKILVVIETVLGIFVAFTFKAAGSSSKLLGRVKVRSREVHKTSDLAKSYFEKIKSRKSRARLTNEERECIQLIKEDPSNAGAYRRLGENYFSRGNFEEAKLSFEQVLRLKPEDEEAQARLGEIDKKIGEPA